MPPEAAYNQDLLATQHKVLLKLAGILDTCQDPKEIRLVAAAVSRLKPAPVPDSKPPSALPPPANAPTPLAASPTLPVGTPATASTTPAKRQAPLRCEELTLLAMLLPHVDPLRFVKKHTPEYWREVIRRNRSDPTQPPASAA